MDSLKTLVKIAQAGHADAYNELVVRFQDMAVGYAYSILSDFHLAQDAFVSAFLELPDLRTPEAFSSWFRRIVFKHCDRIRRNLRSDSVPIH